MKIKHILLVFAFLLTLIPSSNVKAEITNYTYNYDYWAELRESPDPYQAQKIITGNDFSIGNFKDPQGIYVRDNKIYVVDTGNNRIVILERINQQINYVDQISELKGNTKNATLSSPQDVFVSEDGDIYICDTNNQRVLHLNEKYEVIKEIDRPKDETVDPSSDFLPTKIVVDRSGRISVLAKNYNKGLINYDNDGIFLGYTGANEVKFSMIDYLWKLFSTKEQRAQMEQFVPTEYNNIAMDLDGFIYATTSIFEGHELRSDQAKPIRKLNTQGADILVKNGNYPPIGDLYWGNAGGISGASKLIDVTVLDNDTYYGLDRTRGRIFAYDFQGNMLYAFGGIGTNLGFFTYPTAIDHMGSDLIVLDSKTSGITIFTHTEYGTNIEQALYEYKKGDYEKSHYYWGNVLKQNGNYDLAYIGIGRNLLRQEDYKGAMEYFELKFDDDNYSKAFQLYRKELVEENIGWIFAAFFAIIGIPAVIGGIKKMKKELEEA